MNRYSYSIVALTLSLTFYAFAQEAQPDPHAGQDQSSMAGMPGMPGMAGMPGMPGMDGHHHMASNGAGEYLMDEASGTSMNPKSWMTPMIGAQTGAWNWMFMGTAFVVDTQQSGPRGGDKLYSPNWSMIGSEHSLGAGSVMFQTMLSLEPATVTDRRYPELFQTGETAFGKPIADGQHPHDLIMALGVQYAHPVGEGTMFQLYFAPVGDPALGPVAFPHRASASELPQAPIGHHWEDSTHIANEVITAGMSHGIFRVEASGFHGREPNENRWNIDYGAVDSWSTRLSIFPTANWMGQVSMGRLHSPEALEPGDEIRSTASLHYSKPIGNRSWSTSLIWGRNHKTAEHRNSNAYGLESVAPVGRNNFLTGRIELVDKDELFDAQPDIKALLERTAGVSFRIGAYTLGYTRDIKVFRFVETGVGANFSAYTLPTAIQPYYGAHPFGANVYVRFRLGSK